VGAKILMTEEDPGVWGLSALDSQNVTIIIQHPFPVNDPIPIRIPILIFIGHLLRPVSEVVVTLSNIQVWKKNSVRAVWMLEKGPNWMLRLYFIGKREANLSLRMVLSGSLKSRMCCLKWAL
jgi:hypothetical protein